MATPMPLAAVECSSSTEPTVSGLNLPSELSMADAAGAAEQLLMPAWHQVPHTTRCCNWARHGLSSRGHKIRRSLLLARWCPHRLASSRTLQHVKRVAVVVIAVLLY
jgi:hypothetical protein